VASIPTPGGRNLHPVKKRGKSYVEGADQNVPPYFSLCNLHS